MHTPCMGNYIPVLCYLIILNFLLNSFFRTIFVEIDFHFRENAQVFMKRDRG